jgi:hypothetical protein
MAIERFRLLAHTPKTPVMRPPGRLTVAFDTEADEQVLMRVINTKDMAESDYQQLVA